MATNFFQSAERNLGDAIDEAIATGAALYVTDRFVMPLITDVVGPVDSNGLKHLAVQTGGVVCANMMVKKLQENSMLPTIFGTPK